MTLLCIGDPQHAKMSVVEVSMNITHFPMLYIQICHKITESLMQILSYKAVQRHQYIKFCQAYKIGVLRNPYLMGSYFDMFRVIENGVGRACSTQRSNEKCLQNFSQRTRHM